VSETLLIGELARLAGVKRDAVRFYERSGLLARPVRSANGYRAYDETALARLRFIQKAQSLGFSLDEVKRILSLRERQSDLPLRGGDGGSHPGRNRTQAPGDAPLRRLLAQASRAVETRREETRRTRRRFLQADRD